ncbi:hypothetical protein ACIBCC_19120 [Streptomyces griseus]|uniref:hypothetical protein n=1 Tax=Streptomyces griseus TaxID=1911 RepID=UPI0037AABF1E
MTIGRVNAAKYLSPTLDEPHETDFGGKEARHRMATVLADHACPPSGYSISWHDCYLSAALLSLTHQADLLTERNGEPSPVPDHLVGEPRELAIEVGLHAAWVRREAHRRGLH